MRFVFSNEGKGIEVTKMIGDEPKPLESNGFSRGGAVKELTPRQEAFAAGVAQGLTQAEAYRQAYPKSCVWKDETVWSRASRLAADYNVSTRIRYLNAKAAAANEVTQERVVRELARIAFADLRSVTEWGPAGVTLRNSSDLSDDEAAAVAEVSETWTDSGGGSRKVKMHDKVAALEKLARHIGLYDSETSTAVTIERSYAR